MDGTLSLHRLEERVREDDFVLGKLFETKAGRLFLSENLHCLEELLRDVRHFLRSLLLGKPESLPFRGECLLKSFGEELGESALKVSSYAERLKLLEGKIRELYLSGEYEEAYCFYLEYARSLYALIALVSFSEIRFLDDQLKRDPLTGVLSRKVLKHIFRSVAELSQIAEVPFTVALLDVDDFKKVNDRLGHLAGDCLLRKLARLIKKHLRKGDYLFRYGGEEFLLLLPSASAREAFPVLERIRRAVEKTRFRCGGEVSVTVSVGAVSAKHDGVKSHCEYLKEADERLYEAKRAGKNRVVAEDL